MKATTPLLRFLTLAAFLAEAGCASSGATNTAPARSVITAGAAPLAAYSPAVRTGDLLFFSGQIGRRPDGTMPTDIGDQVRQTLANLRTLLDAAGIGPEDLVKCTVFLTDIADYGAMNEAYAEFFRPHPPPARSAVAVAGLPAGARVEIDCIGVAAAAPAR